MLVADFFNGTGSISLALSHFGPVVVGTDIDYRVLHGEGIGYLNPKVAISEKPDGYTNFSFYK